MSDNTMALLSGSAIIVVYGVVLTIFFLVLVTLTIILFKQKNNILDELYEDEDSDKESDDDDDEEEEDDYGEDTDADEGKDIKDSIFSMAEAEMDGVCDKEESENDDADRIEENTDMDNDKDEEASSDVEVEEEKNEEADTESEEESEEGTETENETAENEESTDTESEATEQTLSEDGKKEEFIDSAFAENSAFPTGSVFEENGIIPESEPGERVMYVEEEIPADSAFAPEVPVDSSWMSGSGELFDDGDSSLTDAALAASINEAAALKAAVTAPRHKEKPKPAKKSSKVIGKSKKPYDKSSEDFYWYNKLDVEDRPSYKTPDMYYHYFNIPQDCIDDLLMEMYDCALVKTEEIRYIAYGIAPKVVSMKEILSEKQTEAPKKIKNPSTQDLIKIYEKWCGYVDRLFEIIEINADTFTIDSIRELLYDYGKSDVDVLLEVK